MVMVTYSFRYQVQAVKPHIMTFVQEILERGLNWKQNATLQI